LKVGERVVLTWPEDAALVLDHRAEGEKIE
jgi:hypothetical protein